MTVITQDELSEIDALVDVLGRMPRKSIGLDAIVVRDSNGDLLGKVVTDYGDVQLEVGELKDE